MPNLRHIACLVLGAGRSERFGATPKLEAMLGERRVGDLALETLSGFDFGEHVFVCRAGGFVPSNHRFKRVETMAPLAGQGHSLALGAAALAGSGCAAVLIALADMPLISARHIAALCAEFSRSGGAVVSAVGEIACPPAILPIDRLIAFQDAGEDQGAKALLADAQRLIAPADDLLDIDSPADLARASVILAARGAMAQ